jgi:hypothetical protein
MVWLSATHEIWPGVAPEFLARLMAIDLERRRRPEAHAVATADHPDTELKLGEARRLVVGSKSADVRVKNNHREVLRTIV